MKAIPFYILFTCMGCIFPLQLANTCSWGYDIDESNLSPFNSEMLGLPELFPFYYSEHYYNGDPNTDWSSLGGTIDLSLFDGTQQNLEEWSSYFKGIPISDIQSIIYNTSVDDYSAFAIALKLKSKFTVSGPSLRVAWAEFSSTAFHCTPWLGKNTVGYHTLSAK